MGARSQDAKMFAPGTDGSIVLGSLLGYQHRIDWKDCYQSEAEEKDDAQTFKKTFAPFHG